MTTPLPEPHCLEWSKNGWVNNFYSKPPKDADTITRMYTEAQLRAYGAAEYKRGTEALQAMTAERNAFKQRQEGDALSIQCYQAQVDDLSKLLHQALDERDHYVKERDGLIDKLTKLKEATND